MVYRFLCLVVQRTIEAHDFLTVIARVVAWTRTNSRPRPNSSYAGSFIAAIPALFPLFRTYFNDRLIWTKYHVPRFCRNNLWIARHVRRARQVGTFRRYGRCSSSIYNWFLDLEHRLTCVNCEQRGASRRIAATRTAISWAWMIQCCRVT